MRTYLERCALIPGETEAIVVPMATLEAMKEQLRLISQSTPPDKHAVVIMDQTSWHQSYLADSFKNLTIIHIPPHSPELNPIEQVWSWLRQNEIANRCFECYDILSTSCVVLGIVLCRQKQSHFALL